MSVAGPSTVALPVVQAPVGRRRLRDRMQQVLTAAAAHFRAFGYHRVAMADIVAAVGIGPSARCRHDRSKQDLLLDVLSEALDRLGLAPEHPEDLNDLIRRVGTLGLERREFAAGACTEPAPPPPAAHGGQRTRAGGAARCRQPELPVERLGVPCLL